MFFCSVFSNSIDEIFSYLNKNQLEKYITSDILVQICITLLERLKMCLLKNGLTVFKIHFEDILVTDKILMNIFRTDKNAVVNFKKQNFWNEDRKLFQVFSTLYQELLYEIEYYFDSNMWNSNQWLVLSDQLLDWFCASNETQIMAMKKKLTLENLTIND